jgi:hypothetical protein
MTRHTIALLTVLTVTSGQASAQVVPAGTLVKPPSSAHYVTKEKKFLISRQQLDFANAAVSTADELQRMLSSCETELEEERADPTYVGPVARWALYGVGLASAFMLGFYSGR